MLNVLIMIIINYVQILAEIKPKLLLIAPSYTHALIESYYSQFQLVSGQLRGFVYKAMCPTLIKFNAVSLKRIFIHLILIR